METVVFAVGVFIFFITVWGAVMAGGLRLTKAQIEGNPTFQNDVDQIELDKTLPTDVKY